MNFINMTSIILHDLLFKLSMKYIGQLEEKLEVLLILTQIKTQVKSQFSSVASRFTFSLFSTPAAIYTYNFLSPYLFSLFYK